MTESETKKALAMYEARLRVAQHNLECARADVTHARENVDRMRTALRSIRAQKGRAAHRA